MADGLVVRRDRQCLRNFRSGLVHCDEPCLVAQLGQTLCDPRDRSQPGSSVHGDSPGKNTGVVAMLPSDQSFTKD